MTNDEKLAAIEMVNDDLKRGVIILPRPPIVRASIDDEEDAMMYARRRCYELAGAR